MFASGIVGSDVKCWGFPLLLEAEKPSRKTDVVDDWPCRPRLVLARSHSILLEVDYVVASDFYCNRCA